MAILSYEFAICFTLFFIIYWAFYKRPNIQNILLLLAGIGFLLTWQWLFVASVVFVWLVLQICIYGFSKVDNQKTKKIILIVGLVALVGHLSIFKYSNFIIEQLNQSVLGGTNNLTPLDIIMPLGISFYTFQAISYLVDVYQEKMKPMPSTILLGFLSFFPTITAGPIFRARDAQPQWQLSPSPEPTTTNNTTNKRTKNNESLSTKAPNTKNKEAPDLIATDTATTVAAKITSNAVHTDVTAQTPVLTDTSVLETSVPDTKVADTSLPRRYVIMPYIAMALIIIALFKKLVLASWLETLWVTPVFANPLQFHGLEVLTAIYAYSLQLFFDFSGYTDLVLAIALLLGFRLPENFNRPYLATDIQDFWKKWHITLSHWIRDYLYIPLGGSRRSYWRVQFNLMMAFIISGVWHGAGWNFFIWGAIHGVALVFLNLLKRFNLRFWLTNHAKPVAIFLTFHYVAFGWVFFHSVTFNQAMQVLTALGNFQDITLSLSVVPTLSLMLLAWIIYPYLGQSREKIARALSVIPWWLLPIPIALYVVLMFSLAPEGLPGFIYANF